MLQFKNKTECHNVAVIRIQRVGGENYMAKKNNKSKSEKAAKEPEYIISEFFTGKKTLKESLLALIIRDMKKL